MFATLHSADKDECASEPCQNGGVCFDEMNSFKCECGFRYTGTTCETGTSEDIYRVHAIIWYSFPKCVEHVQNMLFNHTPNRVPNNAKLLDHNGVTLY